MAALYAKQNKYDDVFLLNTSNRVCDSTISNIFWIKNGVIHTPPLSEGCIAGVMRRHLLNILPSAGFSVMEQPAGMEDILHSDEVFLTNAISGMRWVGSMPGKDFVNDVSKEIFHSTFSSE